MSTPLLDEAQRLLDENHQGTAGRWARAGALLARQQLETTLREYWAARAPELRWVTTRAQLLCLREYAGREVAADAAYAWSALSRVTHHHPYELDPTREELSSLYATVRHVSSRLQG